MRSSTKGRTASWNSTLVVVVVGRARRARAAWSRCGSRRRAGLPRSLGKRSIVHAGGRARESLAAFIMMMHLVDDSGSRSRRFERVLDDRLSRDADELLRACQGPLRTPTPPARTTATVRALTGRRLSVSRSPRSQDRRTRPRPCRITMARMSTVPATISMSWLTTTRVFPSRDEHSANFSRHFSLEWRVAHREDLVDEPGCLSSTWIATGEGESHEHARGVVLDLLCR